MSRVDQCARIVWLCATLAVIGCDAYDEQLLDSARASSDARRPGRSPFLTLDGSVSETANDPEIVQDASPGVDTVTSEVDAGEKAVVDAGAPDGPSNPNPDAPNAASDAGGGGIVVGPEPVPEPVPDDDAGVGDGGVGDAGPADAAPPAVPCVDLNGTESPDGHCYFPLSTLYTWFVARDRCIQLGGDLVSITSQQEQTFVAPLIVGSPHWIGLARFGSRFTWHNGELFAFANFAAGEPNDEGEVGVVFGNLLGTWFDTDVRDSFLALCERP